MPLVGLDSGFSLLLGRRTFGRQGYEDMVMLHGTCRECFWFTPLNESGKGCCLRSPPKVVRSEDRDVYVDFVYPEVFVWSEQCDFDSKIPVFH
jgi:hypothetical protein